MGELLINRKILFFGCILCLISFTFAATADEKCWACHGTGRCYVCNGDGWCSESEAGLDQPIGRCLTCGGSGLCTECGGDGILETSDGSDYDDVDSESDGSEDVNPWIGGCCCLFLIIIGAIVLFGKAL